MMDFMLALNTDVLEQTITPTACQAINSNNRNALRLMELRIKHGTPNKHGHKELPLKSNDSSNGNGRAG